MNYDDLANVYLQPLASPIPEPVVPATPARRLRDALEPIATQGWWSREVSTRIAALGLEDFFGAYVWGRAAALGEPDASVVVATFGVFETSFLTSVYEAAKPIASRDAILQARADGAAASLNRILGPDAEAEVAEVADALVQATDAADGVARPLFSGLRSLPVPSDPYGRLWRGAELVREHRGDSHLAACIGAGLDRVEMTVMTELWLGYAAGEYLASRGYGPEAAADALGRLSKRGWVNNGFLSATGLAVRNNIEATTDLAQQELVDALGDQLDQIVERTAAWSKAVVDARAFPPDPRKRAAG